MAKKNGAGRVTELSVETFTTTVSPGKGDSNFIAGSSSETITTTSSPNRNRGKYAAGRHIEQTVTEKTSKTEKI